MQYATIEDVEAYGGFTNPTEAERALLDTLISVASKMIDDECNRVFGIPLDQAPATKTFTEDNGLLPGTGLLPDTGRTLYIDDDLFEIASIPTLPAGTTITMLPDHPPYYGMVRNTGAWENPTTIAGDWAYSRTPPAAIVNTTCRLVTWLYHQRESVMSQGNTVNAPNRMPADVVQVLSHYRRIRLP
jgi:hypothetical protein